MPCCGDTFDVAEGSTDCNSSRSSWRVRGAGFCAGRAPHQRKSNAIAPTQVKNVLNIRCVRTLLASRMLNFQTAAVINSQPKKNHNEGQSESLYLTSSYGYANPRESFHQTNDLLLG